MEVEDGDDDDEATLDEPSLGGDDDVPFDDDGDVVVDVGAGWPNFELSRP